MRGAAGGFGCATWICTVIKPKASISSSCQYHLRGWVVEAIPAPGSRRTTKLGNRLSQENWYCLYHSHCLPCYQIMKGSLEYFVQQYHHISTRAGASEASRHWRREHTHAANELFIFHSAPPRGCWACRCSSSTTEGGYCFTKIFQWTLHNLIARRTTATI